MNAKIIGILTATGIIAGHLISPDAPLAEKACHAHVPAGQSRLNRVSSSPADTSRATPPAARAFSAAESASFSQWESRLKVLTSECGNRGAAVTRLLGELDERYGKWVAAQLEALSGTPAVERLDALTEMEGSMREGAAAILDHLNIEGSRHASVLVSSMEAVAAEIRYAEAAPDHSRRLALLRLDREREELMGQALVVADEGAKAQTMSEIDTWYESGLRAIHTPGDVN